MGNLLASLALPAPTIAVNPVPTIAVVTLLSARSFRFAFETAGRKGARAAGIT
jgi:hypothetical protein